MVWNYSFVSPEYSLDSLKNVSLWQLYYGINSFKLQLVKYDDKQRERCDNTAQTTQKVNAVYVSLILKTCGWPQNGFVGLPLLSEPSGTICIRSHVVSREQKPF